MRQRSRRRTTLKGGSYQDQNGFEDVRLRLAAIVNSSNDEVIPKSLNGVISINAPLDAERFTAKRWNAGCQRTVDAIAGQEHETWAHDPNRTGLWEPRRALRRIAVAIFQPLSRSPQPIDEAPPAPCIGSGPRQSTSTRLRIDVFRGVASPDRHARDAGASRKVPSSTRLPRGAGGQGNASGSFGA